MRDDKCPKFEAHCSKLIAHCSFLTPICRVALGGCPPRAPTDPYVHALEHTVPQVMVSLLDV